MWESHIEWDEELTLDWLVRYWEKARKAGYLKDMPLVMHYLRKAADRYRELGPFLKLLDELENRAKEVGYTF